MLRVNVYSKWSYEMVILKVYTLLWFKTWENEKLIKWNHKDQNDDEQTVVTIAVVFGSNKNVTF